jgi:threonine/homoserine/homoserine lactone efflux protein
VTLPSWMSLAAICLLGAMSPGPSLAVVVWNTLKRGRAAGYVAAVSHACAVALYGLMTVLGLAALIAETPALLFGLQLCGSAYLLYLGIKSLRSDGAAFMPVQVRQKATHGAAVDGFLITLLNPKIALFMLALFSQFITPDAGWPQRWVMVSTLGLLDALWFCSVVTLVSRKEILARLQAAGTLIDRGFGIVLILLALSVLGSVLFSGQA